MLHYPPLEGTRGRTKAKHTTMTIKTTIPYLLTLLLLWVCSASIYSQSVTYPVQVYTQLTPPYTPYVPSYYTGVQQKLKVTLVNTDMQQPLLQVYLRMKITSSSFSMITPPEVYTPAIELQAGLPLQLSIDDLAVYFKRENLRVSGNSTEFYRTQLLPDNFYRFQFEVYELNTNRLLSNSNIGFAQAMIAAGKPPILNLPEKGTVITESNIPSIFFSWTPRHMNSIAAAYGTEYQFTLVEIHDKQTSPENAFQYSPPLYTETVKSTSFIHSAAQQQLQPGLRYAWQVRVVARDNVAEEASIFKNDGYSPIYWFDYAADCKTVQTFGAVYENRRINVTWMDVGAMDYVVEYRKKGSAKWYTGNNLTPGMCEIYGLQLSQQYEYRIGSRCLINDVYQYSEIKAFRMPDEEKKSPNCGILPDVNLSNKEPLRALQPDDIVLVGDYPIHITKVSGSGTFTGEGYVAIPFLNKIKVAVRFNNITVNTDYKLVSGFFETKYDENKNNLLYDMDKDLAGGKGVGDIRTGEEKAQFVLPFVLNPNVKAKPTKGDTGEDAIKGSNGDYVFTKDENDEYKIYLRDDKGNTHEITTKTLLVTVEDKDSKVYQIDEKGNITPIASKSDIKLDPATINKPREDIAQLVFMESDKNPTKYAVDQYDPVYATVIQFYTKYKLSDEDMIASAKFMLPGASDEIFVKVEETGKDFDADKVRFITAKGKEYTATYDKGKNGWYLTLVGSEANDGQELYVVQQEDENKYATLAKLNIYTYAPQSVKVKLVPVNGFYNNFTKESVSRELNAIYNKVGITCEVDIAPSFSYTFENNVFNVTGSGLFSTQTADMKAINNAYMQTPGYDESTLYLFIIENVTGNEGVAGDMPRGKQFGYLFPGAKEQTIAHEVGHGVFNLEHPFSLTLNKSFKKEDLQDNLMQYFKGTRLTKYQWDGIHAPGRVIGLFEKDEDAMSEQVYHSISLGKVVDLNTYIQGESINYITPDGRIIMLDKSIQPSFTGIVYSNTAINKRISKGVLLGFQKGRDIFLAVFHNGNYFQGYYKNGDYTNDLNLYGVTNSSEVSTQKVLVGIEQDDCNLQLKTFEYSKRKYISNTGKLENIISGNLCPDNVQTIGQVLISDCHYSIKGEEIIKFLNENGYDGAEYAELVDKIGRLVSLNAADKYDDFIKFASENKPLERRVIANLEKFYNSLEAYYKKHETATNVTDVNCPDCPKYPVSGDAYWDSSGRYWAVKDGKWLDLSGEFGGDPVWKLGIDVQQVHQGYYALILDQQVNHPWRKALGYRDKEAFEQDLWRRSQFAVVHILKEQWVADELGYEVFIPVYGSLMKSYLTSQVAADDIMLQTQVATDAAFGISDIFMVRALASGLYKLSLWAGTKIAGQDICYFAKKQLITARLSFQLSTEAPLEARSLLNKTDDVIEIVCKENSRFIKYDLGTGETLVCGYTDDALQLTFEDFQKMTLTTVGKSEDDITRVVVEKVAESVTKAGTFTTKQIDDYVKLATKNPNAKKVMLGEFAEDVTSYTKRAGTDHTYFDMGGAKWSEAEALVGSNSDEMWRINKEFIDQQKALGKDFYFSHEPWDYPTGKYRSREAEYLIDLGAKDFQKINENTWRVIW